MTSPDDMLKKTIKSVLASVGESKEFQVRFAKLIENYISDSFDESEILPVVKLITVDDKVAS